MVAYFQRRNIILIIKEVRCLYHNMVWSNKYRMADQDLIFDHFVGLVVKMSTSRAKEPGSIPTCAMGTFSSCYTTQYPIMCLDAIGSMLRHVGPVSVYCDWVKQKV